MARVKQQIPNLELQEMPNANLHFNIRQKQREVPTPLYAVFVVGGKQKKVPTGLKVYPSQWDNKRQVAEVSNFLRVRDNRNNHSVNLKMSAILERFKKLREQLDNSPEAWGNILDIVTLSINNQKTQEMSEKTNTKKTKKKEPLILYLQRIIEKRGKEKGTNMIQYNQCVKRLKAYMDAASIEDDKNVLGLRLMNGFKQWLEDSSGLQVKTIRETQKSLKFLIEYINRSEQREGEDFIDIRAFVQTKDNRKKEDRQAKSEPLTVEEVTTLWQLQGLTPKEEEARDIFVAQCLCGQRISDLPKVLSEELEITTIEGVECMTYRTQKTKETAVIPLFPIVKQIREKYKGGFKHFTALNYLDDSEKQQTALQAYNAYLNITIRKVAEKAGLDRPVTYGEQVGIKKTLHTEPLHKVMHTHTARHTFVSIMARLGVAKEYIKIVTGHTNDAIIDKVYLHVTPEDKGKKLVEALLQNDKLRDNALFNTPAPQQNVTPSVNTAVPDLLLQQIQKDAVEKYKMQQEREERDKFVREYGMTPEDWDDYIEQGLNEGWIKPAKPKK